MHISIFDPTESKTTYAVIAFCWGALWYGFVIAVLWAFVRSSGADTNESSVAHALWNLVAGVVFMPLVENYLFTRALDFLPGNSLSKNALIGALVAAVLHFSPRSFYAFGLFYIVAVIYLVNKSERRSYGFWLGYSIHAVFNIPASILPLLLVTGMIEK